MTPPLLVLPFRVAVRLKAQQVRVSHLHISYCLFVISSVLKSFMVSSSSCHRWAVATCKQKTPHTLSPIIMSHLIQKKNSTFCSLKYSTVILSFNGFSLTLSLIHISCFTMLFREVLCWSWIHFLFPKHWWNYDFCESKTTSMFRNLKLFLFCSGIWKKTDSSEGYGSNFKPFNEINEWN